MPRQRQSFENLCAEDAAPAPDRVLLETNEIIGRTSQYKQLYAAIGRDSTRGLPGALFLWGAPSTGKSYTLGKVLERTDIHVIRINASEILCGRRAFYETFLKQLVSRTNRLGTNIKCDSLQLLFANIFDYLSQDESRRKLRVVAIIEGAESLRGEHDDILRFLVYLQDITQSSICVVLISTLPLGQFMPNILDHCIVPIYFQQYTLEELTAILIDEGSSICSSAAQRGAFEFYIKMIIGVFYGICRDLRKILRLVRDHWGSFQKMVDESEDVNLTRLWKKLEPQLKTQFFCLNSVVLPDSITENAKEQQYERKTLDMPLNAKYLLIASYLATHNPPASDKRFFVKSRAPKGRKKRQPLKPDLTVHNSFVRTFELNRLSAIFGSIQTYCDDKAVNKNRNISFMTLLTTLCQNKLIQHIGEDSSGNQKYKCLLDYDMVSEISRSVNFELNNYLYRLV